MKTQLIATALLGLIAGSALAADINYTNVAAATGPNALTGTVLGSTNSTDAVRRIPTSLLSVAASNIVGSALSDLSAYMYYGAYFDDFIGRPPNGNGVQGGVLGLSSANSVGTITMGGASSNTPAGTWHMTDGTTANNFTIIYGGNSSASLNQMFMRGVWTNEWRFKIGRTNNPAVDNNFYFTIGCSDYAQGVPPVDGIYLQYQTNDTHLQYVVSNSSTRTTNTTSLIPVVGTWYKFRWVCTATSSLTNCVCTINGANSYTFVNTDNIPQANPISPNVQITKIDGASSTAIDLDYLYVGYALEATSR